MKAYFKAFLAKFGIRNKYDAERHNEFNRLKQKLERSKSIKNTELAKIIIFSKDRALQLDALLRSYFHYANNPVPIKVLYNASSVEYSEGYNLLKDLFSENHVEFIQEKDFKPDLVKLFSNINCTKILFMVDDLMFKNEIDFDLFTAVDTQKYVASLRLGDHLNYTYTTERKQQLPKFEKIENFLSWSWQNAMGDWSYPLSVDGHLFDKEEIKILVNELDYKAPNSFEDALQLMNPLFVKRKGLCYSNSIIINNPCNKVQTENDNISGDAKIDELNKKWLDGYKINFLEFEGIKNKSAHQDLIYSFTKND